MSNITFKAALNAAKFPLRYGLAGAEVLDPGADVAPRVNPVFAGGVDNVDWNLIQPQYVQNMLPTEKGYRSVDVKDYPASWTGMPDTVVGSAGNIRLDDGSLLAFVGGTQAGNTIVLYTISPGGPSLQFTFSANASANGMSFASVNGRNFVAARPKVLGIGNAFEPVERTGVYAAVVFTYPGGFGADKVIGMCASGNYLVLWTATEILWSTPTNPTDFATLALGAGRQIPVDLMGNIVRCVPISGGFIIYTAKNAVAAFATNNPSTPFRFVSIKESAGLASYDAVAGDANSSVHYAMQLTGFQQVSLNKADHIFAPITEYATLNRQTVVVSATALPTELITNAQVLTDVSNTTQIVLISQRYLVVSVASLQSSGGTQRQNYDILVFDTAYSRWTRLHSAAAIWGVVEIIPASPAISGFLGNCYILPGTLKTATPAKRIAIAKDFGEVLTGPINCIIIGRCQLRRSKNITITSVEVYGSYAPQVTSGGVPDPVTTPICTLLSADSGSDREIATQLTLVESAPGYWRFDGRITAKNIDILLSGRWEITAVIVLGQNHGIR